MCLDAHAHGMRVEHDIFHTPHSIALTLEKRPAPDAYVRSGVTGTMPMWRVQTEGYTDGTDQLVGVVSRDAGFLDSPDTEWISGGVNTKTPGAVALGRHGNFFHWGFAASPTYLTDEAKLVFVNAVHYIARFSGRTPIARKRPGTMVRRYVEEALAAITDEGHARVLAAHDKRVAEMKAKSAEIRARIAAGEEVSELERQIAGMRLPKAPGRFDWVRRFVPDDVWPRLDGDVAAITAWLEAKLPFMRPAGWYELEVDAELERFGVASDDIALLDRAVAALGTADEALARRLLGRYTAESFATRDEWAAWLEENRERLFFTEAGGYKWLVDSRDVTDAPAPSEIRLPEPTANDPVAGVVEIAALAGGGYALTLHVAILDGWHGYKSVPPGSPYVPMTVELELPAGIERDGDWTLPRGGMYPADPGVTVYEGDLVFRCRLKGRPPATPGEVACVLSYQVCDERMCLPPDSKRLTGKID